MSFYNQSFEHLEIKKEDNTLWIYLNRPERRNAISLEMIDSLCRVLKHADFDSDIHTMVLSGRGKAFCAGGDIKDMKSRSGMFSGNHEELRQNYMKGIQQIPLAMDELQTPIVAMINGHAMGAGLDIACMCDLRICSEEAKLGETFASLALIPGDGGLYFLSRVVGASKAREMALTCNIYTGTEAQEMGLVTKSVPLDQLESETRTLISQLQKPSYQAQTMIKRGLKQLESASLRTHLDFMAAFQGITQSSPEHLERLGK